jgi:hypothetical protein
MMEAVSASGTSVNVYDLHSATSHKTVIFNLTTLLGGKSVGYFIESLHME